MLRKVKNKLLFLWFIFNHSVPELESIKLKSEIPGWTETAIKSSKNNKVTGLDLILINIIYKMDDAWVSKILNKILKKKVLSFLKKG